GQDGTTITLTKPLPREIERLPADQAGDRIGEMETWPVSRADRPGSRHPSRWSRVSGVFGGRELRDPERLDGIGHGQLCTRDSRVGGHEQGNQERRLGPRTAAPLRRSILPTHAALP